MQRHNFSLACLHRECELNYSRLLRLTDENSCLGSSFRIKNAHHSIIDFKVIELAKFTTTLFIRIESNKLKWLPCIELKARVYRDAKMAEVRKFNGKKQFWLRNRYPNKNMLTKDEKFQWNFFLEEFLTHTKNYGLSIVKIAL